MTGVGKMQAKILFVIPDLGGGGAEKILVNLVNNLDTKKFDVSVLVMFDGGVNRQFLSPKIKYRAVFKRYHRGLIRTLKFFKPEFLFQQLIGDEYDVVVSFYESYFTRIVAGGTGKTKLVSWVHRNFSTTYRMENFFRSKKELLKYYANFDRTYFVSQMALESFINEVADDRASYSVVPNVVETDVIRLQATEALPLKFDPSYFNLLGIGRFTHVKGFERLIKAVARLRDEDDLKVRLYLLGQGELRAEYQKLIQELQMNMVITILDYDANPYKYLKAANLYIVSSFYEGLSTTTTEALIVGTPVLTVNVSGASELLTDGRAGVITENNDESLYLGIRKVLTTDGYLADLKSRAIERGNEFNTDRIVAIVEKKIMEIMD